MATRIERLARTEAALRPWLVRLLPGSLAIRLYSTSRLRVLDRLVEETPEPRTVPPQLGATLWGISFRAPLGNAAGLFKNGRGHDLAARQGAGFFLAGTTTARPREGYADGRTRLPFAPYPRSGAASNRLGLPNRGHDAVAAHLARLERVPGMPVGASVAADPGAAADEALAGLLAGLELYERAGVDFLEINESCPNTGEATLEGSELAGRLEQIAERFLGHRIRPLPVLVKLSVDTSPGQIPALVDLVLDTGFDGLVLGNTSTAYAERRAALATSERRLYDRFVARYGGGVSGRPLKPDSLALVHAAARHLATRAPEREFHLVRTGGVETGDDVALAGAAGASLSQWYTGLFEAFGHSGHGLYTELYLQLLALEHQEPG